MRNAKGYGIIFASVLALASCSDSGSGGPGGTTPGGETPNGDSTPPGSVTVISATGLPSSIDITWIDPLDADLDHIEATCSSSGSPALTASVDSGIQACTFGSLTSARPYTITITAVDSSGNRSASSSGFTVDTASGDPLAYSFIYTAIQLDGVRNDLSARYVLMSDIDLGVDPYRINGANTTGWSPIGSMSSPFTGLFDGNGHTIGNMEIRLADATHTGFFSFLDDGASVKGLTLADVNIDAIKATSDDGSICTGAIAGVISSAAMDDCHSSGSVVGSGEMTGGLVGDAIASTISNCGSSAEVTATNRTGGLVGYANNASIIGCRATGNVVGNGIDGCGGMVGELYGANGYMSDCRATGNVTIDTSGPGRSAGGLVGYCDSVAPIAIERCYAAGAVSGQGRIGGLVGTCESKVQDNYALGAVSGTADPGTYLGGLIGYQNGGSATRCYAAGILSGNGSKGGIAGASMSTGSTTFAACYFDSETTGIALDIGTGTPLSTAQMKAQASYSWDFSTTPWRIAGAINSGYPYLDSNRPL